MTYANLSMDDRRHRFEALVLPHLDAAYRFARWLARSSGDADDVVQEAVLRAFRGFDTLRGSDVKAWLLTIVKNCHLTALKQQQRRGFVPLPEEHDVQGGEAMIATTPDPESVSVLRDEKRTACSALNHCAYRRTSTANSMRFPPRTSNAIARPAPRAVRCFRTCIRC